MICRLRGTKDLDGPEACLWETIEQTAASVFKRYGFEPLRTPLIEEASLFSRSVGESTDIVQKEMYRFADRSGTEIALRPEGTAGAVRAFIENHLGKEKPVRKLYYHGPMFRAERPQAGRLRQFHQIGAEIFGTTSLFADAEIIEAAAAVLRECGAGDFCVRLNSLGSQEDRAAFSIILKDFFSEKKEALCEDCNARLERNVFRVLDCKVGECRQIAKTAPRIIDHIGEAARENFEAIVSMLQASGVNCQKDPMIVRGLDYYTDTVFEVTHAALGAQDAIAAGGRYNGLVEKLGGKPTPAVGFALGIERLVIALQKAGRIPEAGSPDAVLVAAGTEARRRLSILASGLRKEGFRTEMDLDERSMKAQMRQANKVGARVVFIAGENELAKEILILKDMKQSGDASQREIPFSQAAAELRKVLSC